MKEKDLLETVLFDFLIDVSREKINLPDRSIKEVNDFIKAWINKHFPDRAKNFANNEKDIGF